MLGRRFQHHRLTVAAKFQRPLGAGGNDTGHLLTADVADLAFKPQLRVGIHRQPPLRQPRLRLADAPDIDALGHIAGGAHPAMANDQLGYHAVIRPEHPQQIGGGHRLVGITNPEPVILLGIGGAGLGHPKLGQPGQQLTQPVLLRPVATAIGNAPDTVLPHQGHGVPLGGDGQPLGSLQLGGQTGKHQRPRRDRFLPAALGRRAELPAGEQGDHGAHGQDQGISDSAVHLGAPLMPEPWHGAAGGQCQARWRSASARRAPARC